MHYWLGITWWWWKRAGAVTSWCPACYASRIQRHQCHWERWQITTDNGCGITIKDHNIVTLKAYDGSGPLAPSEGWQQQFFIYRMSGNGPFDYSNYFPACASGRK